MAVCEPYLKFHYVSANKPGSTHSVHECQGSSLGLGTTKITANNLF